MNGNLSNQDFTAVLIGDVSGNWEVDAGGGGALLQGGSLLGGMEDSPVELTVPNVISEPGKTATVTVTVGGTNYPAQNLGDGRWLLDANVIDPPLADGTYDVQVHATDVLMRVGMHETAGGLTISD